MTNIPRESRAEARDPNQVPHALRPGAWGIIPVSLVRDRSVSAGELVAVAQRVTYADDRSAAGLNASSLGRIRGLSDRPAKRAIHGLVERQILRDRQQPSPIRLADGTFRSQRATDRLDLPDGPGILVRRDWTDGRLTAKELAALLYLIAGTGLGPVVYRREIGQRFGWGREALRAVLAGLIDRGLLRHVVSRKSNGTIKSHAYSAVTDVDAALRRMQPADGLRPVRSQPVRERPRKRSFPSTENSPDEPNGESYSAPVAPAAHVDLPLPTAEAALHPSAAPTDARAKSQTAAATPAGREENDAWGNNKLLGWADRESTTSTYFGIAEVPEDIISEVDAAFPSDTVLVDLVRKAADGRVHRLLLTAGGMVAVRHVAAGIMCHAREQNDSDEGRDDDHECPTTPHGAVQIILQGIRDRWGSRKGQWLNSYGALGKRLAFQMYNGGVTSGSARIYRPQPVSEEDLAAGKGVVALQAIVEAGGYLVLAPQLQDGPDAIAALLAFLGDEADKNGCRRVDVLSAAVRVLRCFARYGWHDSSGQKRPEASSWSQLAKAIAARIGQEKGPKHAAAQESPLPADPLAVLREADGARLLKPALAREGEQSLLEFLAKEAAKHGCAPVDILEVMADVLRRAVIDDRTGTLYRLVGPYRKFVVWASFERSIATSMTQRKTTGSS